MVLPRRGRSRNDRGRGRAAAPHAEGAVQRARAGGGNRVAALDRHGERPGPCCRGTRRARGHDERDERLLGGDHRALRELGGAGRSAGREHVGARGAVGARLRRTVPVRGRAPPVHRRRGLRAVDDRVPRARAARRPRRVPVARRALRGAPAPARTRPRRVALPRALRGSAPGGTRPGSRRVAAAPRVPPAGGEGRIRAKEPWPGFLASLVELAETGLRRRALGEERLLDPIRGRLERREGPADRARRLFAQGGIPALVDELSYP